MTGIDDVPLSLGTAAARNLATTTKTTPRMRGITSRWLPRMLPWVQADGGVYRVNRRLTYTLGDGRVDFISTGTEVRVIPAKLRDLPLLRDVDDEAALVALAERFQQREYDAGSTLVRAGEPADSLVLIAHGKVNRIGTGEYGDRTVLGMLADGEHFGTAPEGPEGPGSWDCTVQAVTPCTVLTLPRRILREVPGVREHIQRIRLPPRHNKHGEVAIDLASGHHGEPHLTSTYVDYERTPREYELHVAQTILRVHTRVADLYNQPMNQTEQQLRLTIEALRERQEHELLNNPDFGLLHNADLTQRLHTRTGPPTPDDLDALLARRRKTRLLLAHPRTIAAFGRECSARGIYPEVVPVDGDPMLGWRGVPLLPCDKIPVSARGTSSVLAMRVGAENQGVVGLHQTGLPDEYQPGLNVRFMGINDQAILSYLVSTYYSAAVLVPDALGVLERVEITR